MSVCFLQFCNALVDLRLHHPPDTLELKLKLAWMVVPQCLAETYPDYKYTPQTPPVL